MASIDRFLTQNSSSARVLSLDVFDSLILRRTPGSWVESLAARNLHERWKRVDPNECATSEQILDHRRDFRRDRERIARAEGREWSLAAWFDALEEELAYDHPHEWAIRAEIDAEYTATVCSGLSDALDSHRDRFDHVIALSDTWLTESMLERLLARHEIEVDHVITSASRQASKRNGRIFSCVEEHLQAGPGEFVHVGDNFKSDYVRPLGAGWRAAWLPHSVDRPAPGPFLRWKGRQTSWLNTWTAASMPSSGDDPETSLFEFGHDRLAPTLLLHAVWQARIFREYDVQTVFFLAREGHLLLQISKVLEDALDVPWKACYARLSRRAVMPASPRSPLLRGGSLPGKSQPATIGGYLESLGTSERLIEQLLDVADFTRHTPWEANTRQTLQTAAVQVESAIQREQSRAARRLRTYLEQLADRTPLDRIGIVDSGWAGTTQDVIRAALPSSSTVVGAYIGVSDGGRPPTRNSVKRGLIRDDYRAKHPGHPAFAMAGAVRVLELLFTDLTAGTSLSLRDASDGSVEPVVGRAPFSSVPSRLEVLRKGILEGVRSRSDAAALLFDADELISPPDLEAAACVGMKSLLLTPPKEVANLFTSLPSAEGAAPGSSTSLGLPGLRTGTTWPQGTCAKYGLDWLCPLLSGVIVAYDALSTTRR